MLVADRADPIAARRKLQALPTSPDERGALRRLRENELSQASLLKPAAERVHAEQALRESEERLRSALANSTVGVMFWTPEGVLTQVNDAFVGLTGFTREEALGKTGRS